MFVNSVRLIVRVKMKVNILNDKKTTRTKEISHIREEGHGDTNEISVNANNPKEGEVFCQLNIVGEKENKSTKEKEDRNDEKRISDSEEKRADDPLEEKGDKSLEQRRESDPDEVNKMDIEEEDSSDDSDDGFDDVDEDHPNFLQVSGSSQ